MSRSLHEVVLDQLVTEHSKDDDAVTTGRFVRYEVEIEARRQLAHTVRRPLATDSFDAWFAATDTSLGAIEELPVERRSWWWVPIAVALAGAALVVWIA